MYRTVNKIDKNSYVLGFSILAKEALSKDKELNQHITYHRVIVFCRARVEQSI